MPFLIKARTNVLRERLVRIRPVALVAVGSGVGGGGCGDSDGNGGQDPCLLACLFPFTRCLR